MPYPHVIRLRGPWEGRGLSSPTPAFRATVPSHWGPQLGADYRGAAVYRRGFHRPTGLDRSERLWLVCGGVDARGRPSLNGVVLGEIDGYALPAEFDVTGLVHAHNELQLEVEVPPESAGGASLPRPGRSTQPGGPIRDVHLEVRAAHFCSEISMHLERSQVPRLVIAGSIQGEAPPQALEIVVAASGRELAYREVSVCPSQFDLWPELGGPAATAARSPLVLEAQIKLLCGGSAVWQAARHVGLREVEFQEGRGLLTVDGCEIALPLPSWPALGALAIDGGEAPSPGAALVCEQVLPEDAYLRLDAAGCIVIQAVPAAWADRVCPAIAHHVSIVAWTAPVEEAKLSTGSLPAPCCERAWLPRAAACREP